MHMKVAEAIKNLKETMDECDDILGKIATYSLIFLFKNNFDDENKDEKTCENRNKFAEEVKDVNKNTDELKKILELLNIDAKKIRLLSER